MLNNQTNRPTRPGRSGYTPQSLGILCWKSPKDPFDRLIIWQSISRKLTLISQDRAFADYKKLGLKVIW